MDQGNPPEPTGDGERRRTEVTDGPKGRPSARSTLVWWIVAGSAVAAALSDASPVGRRPFDVVWCALGGGLVAWAASRADRATVAWLGAIAAVVGVGGGWLPAACGLAAIATAVLASWDRRPEPELLALSGALAVQALFRGPSYGFLGLPTLVAVAAVLPAVVSGFRRAPGPERRVVRIGGTVVVAFVVVAGLAAGLAALLARSDLQGAGDSAESALGHLRRGDLELALPELQSATSGFDSSSSMLNGPLSWAGRAVPVLGQHVEALGQVSSAGHDLTATTAVAAGSADYKKLKADNGRIDVTQLAAMAGPVRDSADAIVATEAVVSDVESPWLVAPVADQLARLSRELTDAEPTASNAADVLEVAPTLLGAGGEQRYLLQFATPGESRAAGGFVGTYAVLSANDGDLSLGVTGSTQELGPELVDPTKGGGFQFVPPPGWDDLYGRYHVQYFPGNVSASPDWPTDSDVARQIYAQVPEVGDTKGVVYADPTALAALLRLTGPVDVSGVTTALSADNVEQYLYVDQYVQFPRDTDARRNVLGKVTSAVFDALTSRPLPSLGDLADALGPAVTSGHLKFVSFDPKAEELFERTGLAGAWQTNPGADWLSLRSTNMLPNKIDWFLRRDMQVDTVIDPGAGRLESTVTVTLRNEAPADGLPEYLIGNVAGLPRGTNRDALALYSPHTLTAVEIDGTTAAVQRQQGYGGSIYTVPVDIPPGGTATVVYHLSGLAPTGRGYTLDVLHQALAHDDQVRITVRGQGSSTPAVLFDGPLTENTELAAIGTVRR